MKILISGGHLTPALALIDYVLEHHPEDQVVFLGRIYSQDKLKQQSQEYHEIIKRQIEFVPFVAPRLKSPQLKDRLRYVSQILPSFWQASQIVKIIKPDVFLSFGSYVAVPVAVAAYIHKVPIVTHEQTRAVGEATKFIARLARKVAISHVTSQPFLPADKIEVTGNPMRVQLATPQTRPSWLMTLPTKPILLVTGGNQGSEVLNTAIQQSLRHLVKQWFVIHQCGGATSRRDYLRELTKTRNSLPQTLRSSYVVREWISEQELAWVYQHATAAIARSGANTTQELAAAHLPSILVPLPFAHYDEQTLNAKWLSDVGGAILVPQKELSPDMLMAQTQKIGRFSKSMKQKLKSLTINPDGAEKLYDLVRSVVRV